MKFILLVFLLLFITSARSQVFIVKDIKSFGAKGDGVTNDQDAFEAAAAYFNQNGGNGELIISPGTYIVGRQTFTGGQNNKSAYTGENVMRFAHITNFTVSGESGSLLKYAPGLRFGAFAPTGEAYLHGNNYFVNAAYKGEIGDCILIDTCSAVNVIGVNMDGNSDNLVIGGVYGDVGIQLSHTGIYIRNSSNITINNTNIRRFGLDGITVANTLSDVAQNITITNTICDYNGRQGLSWVGGNGLYVQNCKFVHTGRGRFSSPPAAGVDIEAEYVGIKNGVFENCEFADNAGCGLVANTGNSSDCSFTGCTFWGTTTWSVWVTKPRFTFNNCNMYGSVTQGYSADNATDATSFNNCNFEDKLYGGQPTYGNYLVESNNVKRMSFTGCNFTSNTKKLCYLSAPASYSAQEKYQLNNCNFIINNDNLPANDFVGILAGAVATNCTFNFTSADAKAKRYNFGSVNPLTNPAFSGNTVLYQGR